MDTEVQWLIKIGILFAATLIFAMLHIGDEKETWSDKTKYLIYGCYALFTLPIWFKILVWLYF